MNTKEQITKAYDRAAVDYASAFWNELNKKPFDQIILNWFAEQIPEGDTVLEIGSGPGEVSGYLTAQGVPCVGIDLSEKMVENAKKYFPHIQFEVQDFFHLPYKEFSFSGVVGFYAIVNLMLEELPALCIEIKRILRQNGFFLFCFHVYDGNEKDEVGSFFSKEADALSFYYLKVDEVKRVVENAGFQIMEILLRYPYKDIEFQSRRAYFVVKKV